jgi:NADH-quinone oxidoreductase subunit L
MLIWIPLLPFVGFLINNFGARRLSERAIGGVASLAMLAAFGVSIAAVTQLSALPADERQIAQTIYTWIGSADFQIPLGLRLDPLSALMILVVTGIGFLIHVYSTAYMIEEESYEYARYFAYLNLFAAFMLLLVLGDNFLVLFIGWEGVGLCSYLLIGFWYKNRFAADAGKKAFIVNRIGDVAFILGVLLAFTEFGTVDFAELNGAIAALPAETTFGVISAIALLLFIGATGKSAQIPLYVWLPDAMEGPTPVSALIHAATMVTAGVYLIGRNAVLFAHAPDVLMIVAVIGTATALWAGAIGMVQNDIKRVLAYSTVSQLGYMFMAMGVGAYAAGIFHLLTHAFFKALLFLGSGAVIHALAGEQDLRHMGGLKKALPVTYWTFLIGAMAIAGVPLLSGFFSKDEILYRTFAGGHTVLWSVAALTSLMTAFYMFRLVVSAGAGRKPCATRIMVHRRSTPIRIRR